MVVMEAVRTDIKITGEERGGREGGARIEGGDQRAGGIADSRTTTEEGAHPDTGAETGAGEDKRKPKWV